METLAGLPSANKRRSTSDETSWKNQLDIDRILIAYDGSEGARNAIERAVKLLGRRRALVVFAAEQLDGSAGGEQLRKVALDHADEDDVADRVAREGAELAQTAGFDATPAVIAAGDDPSDAIVAAAEELDAALVVMGSRGGRGAPPIRLGSVSHGVLHKTRRPTLVIAAP